MELGALLGSLAAQGLECVTRDQRQESDGRNPCRSENERHNEQFKFIKALQRTVGVSCQFCQFLSCAMVSGAFIADLTIRAALRQETR